MDGVRNVIKKRDWKIFFFAGKGKNRGEGFFFLTKGRTSFAKGFQHKKTGQV